MNSNLKNKLKNPFLCIVLLFLLMLLLIPLDKKTLATTELESDPTGTITDPIPIPIEPNPEDITYVKDQFNKPKLCTNYFNCTLINEIEKTHKFLLKNKKGLYTPDERLERLYNGNLVPEYVRLNINSQAMAYLVLYENTRKPLYLNEANDRLTFMYGLPQSLVEGGFSQIAYTYLYAYEITGNTSYLDKGMGMTQRNCLNYDPNNRWSQTLNWGLMCSMALGKAYKFTNNTYYLQLSRDIVRRTISWEFPNGLLPHIPGGGPNMGYSTWMYYEMSMNRIDDPNNPDNDVSILKGADFLANHINPDGSLIYEDQYGSYDSNPGNLPSRGDVAGLASVAYILRSTGKDAEAKKVLNFLFSLQVPNKNSGAYTDMYPPYSTDPTYSNSTFITTNVSVLRTSLTFWFLSSISSINNHPCSTPEIACIITPNDCNVGFRDLNSCNLNSPGINYCINGVYTGCMNKNLVTVSARDCEESYKYCDNTCTVTCDYIGPRKCINNNCSTCISKSAPICESICDPDRACIE